LKLLYNRLTGLLIILAVFVTGCGGGNSSGPHAPSLSGLYLLPSSVDQYTGSGTTDVYFQFDFADAGGDLASMTIAVYDADGIELGSATDTLDGAAGITDGYIYGYITADTTVAGNYAIKISMTDSQGKTSNIVEATFTVIPVASVVSIDVTPANPTILKQGSQQFTATANYDDGSKLNVTSLSSWASSDISVSAINSTGLATGTGGGSCAISALFSGISGSTTLTVADVPLVSIAVTPQDPAINKDASQQLTAVGTFANSMTLDIGTSVSWSSSAPAVATVNSWGRVTGHAGGYAVITATSGTVQDSSTVHILADFGPAAVYSGSSIYLGSTAIGDLNGDGRNDVAVTEGGYSQHNRIVLYYQNAHALDAQQLIMTDLSLSRVVIADINNDGLAELIVGGYASSNGWPYGRVYVYTQDPVTHALNEPLKYPISTHYVAGLASADLNDDGLPDIVASGQGWGNSNTAVSFLFQNPDGTLATEATYTFGTRDIGVLHVADMNNDGMNDVVLKTGDRAFSVIKQISDGLFSSDPKEYAADAATDFMSFALGDLNADGRTDVVVGSSDDDIDVLHIFLQNDSGLLNWPHHDGTGLGQFEVHIADTNGDGRNDIIEVNDNHIRILHQNTYHYFNDVVNYNLTDDTSGTSVSLSYGDVTGDGVPDIVTTYGQTLYVLPHVQ
jgi:hypothetical protein